MNFWQHNISRCIMLKKLMYIAWKWWWLLLFSWTLLGLRSLENGWWKELSTKKRWSVNGKRQNSLWLLWWTIAKISIEVQNIAQVEANNHYLLLPVFVCGTLVWVHLKSRFVVMTFWMSVSYKEEIRIRTIASRLII